MIMWNIKICDFEEPLETLLGFYVILDAFTCIMWSIKMCDFEEPLETLPGFYVKSNGTIGRLHVYYVEH